MIVVPVLHPSREILARVVELRPGAVHRTAATVETVGGKGVNVGRFALAMGGSVRLIVLADEPLVHALTLDRILVPAQPEERVEIVPSRTGSRVDLAVVDRHGAATVVNGTAAAPTEADIAMVEARTLEWVGSGDVLVLAGSLPPGTAGVLERLARSGRDRGATVIVDASGRWLAEAMRGTPHVVKINAEEAGDSSIGVAATARPEGFEAVGVLAVTAGADGLRAWHDEAAWQITPPPGLAVVNTLGAGDAVTAGLALGIAGGRSPIDALRLGVAMAAARLRHFEMTLDPADVPALERTVRVERLA